MNVKTVIVLALFRTVYSAFAQFVTTTQLGDFSFSNGTDCNGNWFGGSTVKIGDMSFHNYSSANGCSASGSTVSIGNMAFHNLTFTDGCSMSGTSQYLGDFGFHNFFYSDGGLATGSSMAIGGTGYSWTDVNKFNSFDEAYADFFREERGMHFKTAEFTFGENGRRLSNCDSNIRHKPSTRIFDISTNTITAAGILISPDVRNKDSKPGLTIDEIYARVQEAVKNKHFVMDAKVVGIYENTHRVLLDSCDTIAFDSQEFSKVKGRWKVGDLVSVSEWLDDDGNFLEYEFWVYATSPVKGDVVDVP